MNENLPSSTPNVLSMTVKTAHLTEGNSMEFTRQEKTNILPLRWLANGLEVIAKYALSKYLYYLDKADALNTNISFIARIWAYISDKCYAPYFKWGTYYTMVKETNADSNTDDE